MNPCLPIHHTAATLRAWAIWRHAHPGWVAKVVVPACVRAGALALPLALPGTAFLPPMPHGGVVFGGPVLSGPAYAPYAEGYGSVFVPGVFELPRGSVADAIRADVVSPGLTETGGAMALSPVGTGAIPVTPMLSGDVPHWLPDRDVPGQSVPPVEVPEPSGLGLLAVAVAAVIYARLTLRRQVGS